MLHLELENLHTIEKIWIYFKIVRLSSDSYGLYGSALMRKQSQPRK